MAQIDSESGVKSGVASIGAVSNQHLPRQRAWRESRALDDGGQFGKYAVVRMLGKGGMSEVYEAVHTGLKKPVALKVMRPELADFAEARERFLREGENAARIRHPNVVDVTDVGEVDELPYLVMELLEGEDLGELLAREGRLPIQDLVDIMLPVVAAVEAGHQNGVVHRDLKPDNIFLQSNGNHVVPKVLDFGVARVLETAAGRRITVDANVLGTPQYMSPEQALGNKDSDERADQYALGVMLYEGVTGRLPRESKNPAELLHSVAFGSYRPPSVYIELPEGFEAIIRRAMEREPDARFASVYDLGEALLEFASPETRQFWERRDDMRPVRSARSPMSSMHDRRSPADVPSIEVSLNTGDVVLPVSTPGAAPDATQEQSGKNGRRIGLILLLALLFGGGLALWTGMRPVADQDDAQLEESPSKAAPAAAAEPKAPEVNQKAVQPEREPEAPAGSASAAPATRPTTVRAWRPRSAPVKTVKPASKPQPTATKKTAPVKPKIKVIGDDQPNLKVID